MVFPVPPTLPHSRTSRIHFPTAFPCLPAGHVHLTLRTGARVVLSQHLGNSFSLLLTFPCSQGEDQVLHRDHLCTLLSLGAAGTPVSLSNWLLSPPPQLRVFLWGAPYNLGALAPACPFPGQRPLTPSPQGKRP